jgi:H+/Cl- antiporter ClcA
MELLDEFFIIAAILSIVLGAYSIYLTRRQQFIIKTSSNGHSRKLFDSVILGFLCSAFGYFINNINKIFPIYPMYHIYADTADNFSMLIILVFLNLVFLLRGVLILAEIRGLMR